MKELEQQVQVLSTMETKGKNNSEGCCDSNSKIPFTEFFSFPQFKAMEGCCSVSENENQCSSTIADIEVTMVENHANLKIRSKRRPKQILKIVAGLHSLSLSVLHLNISTINQIALYCLSVKVSFFFFSWNGFLLFLFHIFSFEKPFGLEFIVGWRWLQADFCWWNCFCSASVA